jgi:hypothetical protein
MSATFPPKLFKRDENGLLIDPPIPYVFNDDGSVNWRKMIRPEFLVPNKQRTQETDISLLEDRDLLILLGGTKELAQIRGFTSVRYLVSSAGPSYFSTACEISWIGNYETNNNPVNFQALADASLDNTQSFAKNYLAATCENRAFTRCVRNFLKINIVGQEEIGVKVIEDVPENPMSPSAVLSSLMKEKNISFDSIKDKLVEEKYEKASEFVSINDIPKPKMFELIDRLKKLKKKKD